MPVILAHLQLKVPQTCCKAHSGHCGRRECWRWASTSQCTSSALSMHILSTSIRLASAPAAALAIWYGDLGQERQGGGRTGRGEEIQALPYAPLWARQFNLELLQSAPPSEQNPAKTQVASLLRGLGFYSGILPPLPPPPDPGDCNGTHRMQW